MSLSADIVGYQGSVFQHTLDERWSMAYAASLNDMAPCYLDNANEKRISTHPVFPVCVEWPAIVESLGANNIDMRNTVHATHDLQILRPMRPTMELETSAIIIGVEQRKPGVYLGWRLDTYDSLGELVCRTYQGNLFLRSQLDGDGYWMEEMPAVPNYDSANSMSSGIAIDVPANLGHTYTECARIWNPIHSDLATARDAGLKMPLLHGTASLALATSAVINELLETETRVTRISGRFSGMVMMPSTLKVKTSQKDQDSVIFFEVVNTSQQVVISDGCIVVA